MDNLEISDRLHVILSPKDGIYIKIKMPLRISCPLIIKSKYIVMIEFKISLQCYCLLLTYILCYLLRVENLFEPSCL